MKKITDPEIEFLNSSDFKNLNNENYNSIILHQFISIFKEQKSYDISFENRIFKAYSPTIMYLFASKKLEVLNLDTNEKTILDNKPYLKTFIEAYKKGENYFKESFEVSKIALYSEYSKDLVNDIHAHYFHKPIEGGIIGWRGIIDSNPLGITHKRIKKYGYYSGVLSKANTFISKYPSIFKNFNKKHLIKNKLINSEKNYSQRQIAIAYCFIKDKIITTYTYQDILKKHSQTTSKKILDKVVRSPKALTILSLNKSTDTKHKKDLVEAKRLLIGVKEIKAANDLDRIISTFQANYDMKY